MGFSRWGYNFDGVYNDPDKLQPLPGVYVCWCRYGDNWKILDVGESDNVRDRVKNHDRSDCWEENCSGSIYYSATYISDKEERINLERKIRETEHVACGEK